MSEPMITDVEYAEILRMKEPLLLIKETIVGRRGLKTSEETGDPLFHIRRALDELNEIELSKLM